MVHNRYLQPGGEDESVAAEVRLLREHGHQVDLYEESNQRISQLGPARSAARTTWSGEAYRELRRRLSRSRPDVVHVQNFFPLISPAAYYAAKAEGRPVVQTLRNYRLVCSPGTLFREGRPCEDCVGKSIPWPGVLHACYRQSRLASAAVAGMQAAHNLASTWSRKVDLYIAPSRFAGGKLVEAGLPDRKLFVKPNFVHPDPGPGEGQGDFALFVGRLTPEKGIETLLEAWKTPPAGLPLKILGDGPLGAMVTEATRAMPEVEWLGHRHIEHTYGLMGEAALVVVPSTWYEIFGRVVIEAFAKGTPVVASDRGALAELVDHGRTGRRFPAGDPHALGAEVARLAANGAGLRRIRIAAREEFESKYTADANYRRLLLAYELAVGGGDRRVSRNPRSGGGGEPGPRRGG